MFRNIAVITIGLAAIANLNAAGIPIGGSNGLTSTYTVPGNPLTTKITDTSTAGTAGENTYVNNLYQGAMTVGYTSGSPAFAPPVSTGGPLSATANGVTFALINETLPGGGSSYNEWAAATGGTSTTTITIPIGIFGVTSVDTMLNDEYGLFGGTSTTVTFDFLNSADDVTFNLVNGTDIRDSYYCTSGSALATCQGKGYYNGSNVDTLSTATFAANSGASDGATVNAFNVWTGSYLNGGGGAYTNTNGTLYLDAQNFYLGSLAGGTTLEDIVITDAQTGAQQSRDGLSAITVFTPEPSTVLLLISGVGALGFIRRKRKA